MHLVNSFMNLYTCLLDEIAAQENAEGADRMSTSQVFAPSKRHKHMATLAAPQTHINSYSGSFVFVHFTGNT